MVAPLLHIVRSPSSGGLNRLNVRYAMAVRTNTDRPAGCSDDGGTVADQLGDRAGLAQAVPDPDDEFFADGCSEPLEGVQRRPGASPLDGTTVSAWIAETAARDRHRSGIVRAKLSSSKRAPSGCWNTSTTSWFSTGDAKPHRPLACAPPSKKSSTPTFRQSPTRPSCSTPKSPPCSITSCQCQQSPAPRPSDKGRFVAIATQG